MKKRYQVSSIKDKRSIVRALNTFSSQYDFILCNSSEVDLNKESMTLYYMDNKNKYFNNIIFSKLEATIDLKSTELILSTIDNLISINKKGILKEKLKEAVKKRDFKGRNSFFNFSGEHISINQILEIVEDEALAKRLFNEREKTKKKKVPKKKILTNTEKNEAFSKHLFNQIMHRIMYFRTGIYSDNNTPSTVKGRIVYTTFTNTINILNKQLNHIIENLFLFEEETKSKVTELNNYMIGERMHKHFNAEHMPNENNTSESLPIDQEAFDDLEIKNKQAHMTLTMIYQEMYGLYNQEMYSEYFDLAFNYEGNVNLVIEYIVEMLEYLQQKSEVLAELVDSNENIKKKYKKFFIRIKKYEEQFMDILQDEDVNYFISFQPECNLSYERLAELQDIILKELNLDKLEDLKNIKAYILDEMHYRYNIGSSEEELKSACYFDRRDHPGWHPF